MATRIVACHQPNFLPWLGYFAKMARSDVFCLLDDVQFTQGHGRHNWTSRVRILGANGPIWLSAPVRRAGEGLQLVSQLRTEQNDARWLQKMLKTITTAYGRAPCFREIFEPLADTLSAHSGNLCDTNIALIRCVHAMLGLETQLEKSSALAVEGTGNQRLINLVSRLGGDRYLSGDGADDYQVAVEFHAAGIDLERMGFRHPVYPQRHGTEFVTGLSVLDALCNIGAAATRELLRSPRDAAIASI